MDSSISSTLSDAGMPMTLGNVSLNASLAGPFDHIVSDGKRWYLESGGMLPNPHMDIQYVLVFMGFVSGLLNLTVLISILGHLKVKKHRNPTMMMIAGQCSTDAAFGIGVAGLGTCIIWVGYPPGVAFCSLVRAVTGTAALASFYSLAVIAYVRYRIVVHEMRTSWKYVAKLIGFFWLLALLIQVATVAVQDHNDYELVHVMLGCNAVNNPLSYFIGFTLMVCLTVVIYCYVKIFRFLGKNLMNCDSVMVMQRRINKMMTLVVLFTWGSWLPTTVIYTLRDGNPGVLPWTVSSVLLLITSLVQPIIFVVYSKEVKEVIFDSWSSLICKKRHKLGHNNTSNMSSSNRSHTLGSNVIRIAPAAMSASRTDLTTTTSLTSVVPE
jgi:hypothetical protein